LQVQRFRNLFLLSRRRQDAEDPNSDAPAIIKGQIKQSTCKRMYPKGAFCLRSLMSFFFACVKTLFGTGHDYVNYWAENACRGDKATLTLYA